MLLKNQTLTVNLQIDIDGFSFFFFDTLKKSLLTVNLQFDRLGHWLWTEPIVGKTRVHSSLRSYPIILILISLFLFQEIFGSFFLLQKRVRTLQIFTKKISINTICLVTLEMVRTPPWLSRALSSPSLFHSTVGWGLPLSTLSIMFMIKTTIMMIMIRVLIMTKAGKQVEGG